MTDEIDKARNRLLELAGTALAKMHELTRSNDPEVREQARRVLLDYGIPLTEAELPDDELLNMTDTQLRALLGDDFMDRRRSGD